MKLEIRMNIIHEMTNDKDNNSKWDRNTDTDPSAHRNKKKHPSR